MIGSDHPEGASGDHESTEAYQPGEMLVPDEAPRQVSGAFRYALVVEHGPQAGLTYVLGEGDTLAGRGADSAIFLGDVTVSRSHAKFFVDADGLRVEDLGSMNGIYVNGERLDLSQLEPNDEVIIGRFHLRVAGGHA